MPGLTEIQGVEIIELLKDILEELRNPMCSVADVLDEVRTLSASVKNIERDVNYMRDKD